MDFHAKSGSSLQGQPEISQLEVPGFGLEMYLRREATVKTRIFFPRPFGTDFIRCGIQPLRNWLISLAASRLCRSDFFSGNITPHRKIRSFRTPKNNCE
jgi:hypothetical protein